MDAAPRIAVVLSAGGLRGAAHVGVLRALVNHGIHIDAIVGVSAGAVIAAYYAAVGLTLDDLAADAERFRGRHLLTYSVNVQLGYRFARRLHRWCGVIPDRLEQLEAASFDRLHHRIDCLGIVCHDLAAGQPRYFTSGRTQDVQLSTAVRASASIPALFPSIAVCCNGLTMRLTDGGISDSVPIAFARAPAVGATHVIVSDCRWIGSVPATDESTVWVRPRTNTGTLWSRGMGLGAAVQDGEAAVTDDVLARIDGWHARATDDFRSRSPSIPVM